MGPTLLRAELRRAGKVGDKVNFPASWGCRVEVRVSLNLQSGDELAAEQAVGAGVGEGHEGIEEQRGTVD
jgi:hypothetical protein